MRDCLVLFIHLIVTVLRLAMPRGARSVVAESVLVKHQLLILNRGRKRAPNLRPTDRIIAGLCTFFMGSSRLLRSAIVLRPATLLHLHNVLRKRKYHMLFSSQRAGRPGPKVPKEELIDVVVAMKRRNPNWGCPRIAQQIVLAFGVEIDKDMVRRIRRAHYRPDPDSQGPSWLTLLGHMKDGLWSCDLFRCESATLRTYWVLLAPILSVLCLNKFPKAPASWRAPRLGFPHPLL
jgi:putative transposase